MVLTVSKGGTPNRVEPIGGRVGFDDDFEKAKWEQNTAFPANGSINFTTINEGPVNVSKTSEENPWLAITAEGFKIASSLLGETTNLMPDAKEAVLDLIPEVTGLGIKPKKEQTEEEIKQKHDAVFARNRIAKIEDDLRKVPQQNLEQRAMEAIRNKVTLDEVGDILGLAHMEKTELTKAHILQAATAKAERQEAVEKTGKDQSFVQAKANTSNRQFNLDDKEGGNVVGSTTNAGQG